MLTLSTGIKSTVSYAKSAKSCPYFCLFFPNLPFHRENGHTYPVVMQNSLCLPARRHITRFADAKSR